MKIRLASFLQPDSIVDGEGIRTVIWTQGCPHHCLGCHNPTTHSFKDGTLYDIEDIKQFIDKLEGQDGITFSGGDPMYQPLACQELAKFAKEKGLSIWCYTGDCYEDILKDKNKRSFLDCIDVLVDGKFEIDKASLDLQFRGSSNQRIIDVKNSLKEDKIILIDKYQSLKNYDMLYHRQEHMYI